MSRLGGPSAVAPLMANAQVSLYNVCNVFDLNLLASHNVLSSVSFGSVEMLMEVELPVEMRKLQ